jgi:LysR family hydrogen peroxide-inducible transcriptional activator
MPEGHCFRSQVLSYCDLRKRNDTDPPRSSPGKVTFESGSFETLIRLVDEGLGATVLPGLISAGLGKVHQKQLRPLVAPVPAREIGLVTARTTLRRSVTEAIVDVLGRELSRVLPDVPRRTHVLDPGSR